MLKKMFALSISISTMLLPIVTEAYPNTLCAMGYIAELSVHDDTVSGHYHYQAFFDTTGFDSPRNKFYLKLNKIKADSSRNDSQIFSETTSLLRDAFTSRRVVRIYVEPTDLAPTFCGSEASRSRVEICTTHNCEVK